MAGSTASFAERPRRLAIAGSPARTVTIAAALLGAACLLSAVEAMLPPLAGVPWLRIGLANIAVVVALLVAGPGTALTVSAGRLVVSGVLGGTLGGPAFVMASAGAAASLAVMRVLSRRPNLTAVGWSAAGAVAHVTGQFVAATVLMSSPWLLALLPASGLVALAFGALVGHLARTVSSRLPQEYSRVR